MTACRVSGSRPGSPSDSRNGDAGRDALRVPASTRSTNDASAQNTPRDGFLEGASPVEVSSESSGRRWGTAGSTDAGRLIRDNYFCRSKVVDAEHAGAATPTSLGSAWRASASCSSTDGYLTRSPDQTNVFFKPVPMAVPAIAGEPSTDLRRGPRLPSRARVRRPTTAARVRQRAMPAASRASARGARSR